MKSSTKKQTPLATALRKFDFITTDLQLLSLPAPFRYAFFSQAEIDALEKAGLPFPIQTNPSTATDYAFIFAENTKLYPKTNTGRHGKWLIFRPFGEELDTFWRKIRNAMFEDNLTYSAKVRTAKDGKGKEDPEYATAVEKPICIYTNDYLDVAEVHRVGKALRQLLNINDTLFYKTDKQTKVRKDTTIPKSVKGHLYKLYPLNELVTNQEALEWHTTTQSTLPP